MKIDGRYIQSLGKAESSTVILQSMISSICDLVQGYLVSPAISPQQVLNYLHKK
ncbi:diguanylate cyclase/phosphodiesterase (GGDEF %26 EAL domains) with PAS/PAC sensor(s) [Vibrio cholerae]|nr:diguanylate cyclase/phosphodiesterase (GGDEF %26 EAL domains) with PAS/PAC sensor(s) [Vibrio cholerae]